MAKFKIGEKVNYYMPNYPDAPVLYEGAIIKDIADYGIPEYNLYLITHPDFILHVNGVYVTEETLDKIKKEF